MEAVEKAQALIFMDTEPTEGQRKLLRSIGDIVEARIPGRLCALMDNPPDHVPEELSYITAELIVRRFNRIGSEGLSSESISGHRAEYQDDDMTGYLQDLRDWAEAMSEKLQAEGYPVYVTGEGAKVEPAPEQAKAEQQAHFLKAEKATYIPYSVKNVRSAPSTSAEIVASYPGGSHIAYDEVYEGDGYRWVSYIGRSGKRRYVACRKADGTPLGDFR